MLRTDRLYRVQAIVIRRRDWGEADRLLTLYTRERGKLQAVAKDTGPGGRNVVS